MVETQNQTGELKEEQASARLCVVTLIQLVGVSLTFFLIKSFPRFFGLTNEADWQRDCLVLAYILVGTIVLLILTYTFSFLRRWKPRISEGVILVTFGVNIITFSLAMARTGGPSHSFFAQLVPMQLSGILILEQQKLMMTSNQSSTRARAWLYAGFTVFVWLGVVLFPLQVASLFGRQETTIEIGLKTYEEWTATILFVLGVVVTAFAYWITPRPGFIASFRRSDRT
jgi:hypothetical protein